MENFLDKLQQYVDRNDDASGILPLFMYVPMYGGPIGDVSTIKLDVGENMELGAGVLQTEQGPLPDMAHVPELFKSMVEETPRMAGKWNISSPYHLTLAINDPAPDGYR